jgi:hypothetical protein
MTAAPRPTAHFLGLMQQAVISPDPVVALRAVTQLRNDLVVLERAHVRRALEAGQSWSQIATSLGVSKQAAHRRHRDAAVSGMTIDELVQRGGSRAKVLVTDEARRSVRLAREEARALGYSSVGSEHLLLGLLRGEPNAARTALEEAGATLEAARVAAEPTLINEHAAPEPETAPAGAFRQHARTVLEQSLSETALRGEGFIGPEHLLLAILSTEEAGAVRTLAALGVETDEVRRRLNDLLDAGLSATGAVDNDAALAANVLTDGAIDAGDASADLEPAP